MSLPTPSPRQIELLHHTLGLSRGRREPIRNHFVAGPGHYAQADLLELVRMDLMERARAPAFLSPGDQVFRVTEAGKALALGQLPAPPVLTRYQQWCAEDSFDSFGQLLLGARLPKMEYQYSGRPLMPLYRMYRVEAGRSWVRDVEGAWCRTKKGAKASYKAALKAHQQRELKKLEEST